VGSGFRTFTAGEVLTASNVQNYLMDQSVMVFGGSAARSSAIGTANFEEGMVSYLTDTDKVEAYDGTNWVSVAPTTSQGLTLINTTSFSAVATQSVSNFVSSTYTHYKIVLNATGSTDLGILFKFRENVTDKSTNYYGAQWRYTYLGASAVVDTRNNGTDVVIASAKSGGATTAEFLYTVLDAGATGVIVGNAYDDFSIAGRSFAYKNGATNITGFSLITSAGTITGSVSVYGFNK
jgi:hypothetical protein